MRYKMTDMEITGMEITSFKHKGLKALHAAKAPKNVKGLPPAVIGKLHIQLSAIVGAKSIHELVTMKMWKVHDLTPMRPGIWAMSVTANWRLTFRPEPDGTVSEVDFEDYH